MKKFLKCLVIIVVCFVTCFAFAGCKGKINYSATTNTFDAIESNGGVVLYYDNYIYFVNGTKTVNETNVKAKNVQGGIYRVYAPNKEIQYLTTKPGEKDEERTLEKVEPVVQSLTGFDNGSIFIFGDFLYYATPCDSKNKDGEMLINKVEFKRYDLKKKKEQLLYTTAQSSDTLTYTYYAQGESLYFVIYEKTNATLKSYKVGSKMELAYEKDEVQSCVLSENFGKKYQLEGSLTDTYIHFTLTYDEESEVRKGSRVFRVTPDGENEKMISEGHSLTLMSIKGDNLIYSEAASGSTIIYAQRVNEQTTELKFDSSSVVCYNSYDNIIFVEDGGKIKALVYDGSYLRFINYVDGELDENENNLIYEFRSGDKITFIGTDGDYVIYQVTSSSVSSSTNIVYKLQYKNLNVVEGDQNYPIKLSTTKLNAASGLMAPEIFNGYIYGFYTDSSAKATYLCRIRIKTPRENGEKDEENEEKFKEVGEAEFIGIRE